MPRSPFDDVWREIEEMNRMMDRMFTDMRDVDWSRVPPGRPVYYGVSMEVGPDGVPRVHEFGNVRPGVREGLAAGGAVREPFITSLVDEERGEVRITAEMPGVPKDAIKVEAAKDEVRLRAEGEDRVYDARVPLRVRVDPASSRARYNNGVLEVTLRREAGGERDSRDVPVE